MAQVHHACFWWLNDPTSEQDAQDLLNAAKAMKDIPGVVAVKVGRQTEIPLDIPADKSFDLGLFMTFESKAAIEAYDPHPLHIKVIEVLQRVTKDFHGFYFEDF